MRVFVLCTGRSGSHTLAAACRYISNYTSGHESNRERQGKTLDERLAFPDRHIEVDHRLIWMAGTLERLYAPDVLYVHLRRDRDLTIRSFALRIMNRGINDAFRTILDSPRDLRRRFEQSEALVTSVEDNIKAFLAEPSRESITIDVEQFADGFRELCGRIEADVDLEAALEVLKIKHSKTTARWLERNYRADDYHDPKPTIGRSLLKRRRRRERRQRSRQGKIDFKREGGRLRDPSEKRRRR